MPRQLTIGEAADAAGVSAKMIRHYEQIGLIAPAARTDAGYRQYGEREVSALRFIRQSRLLGFSIAQIGELMKLWTQRSRSSREVKAIAQRHLRTVEEKLREMQAMQAQLQRLVSACHGDEQPDCAILDELAVRSALVPEAAATPARSGKTAKRTAAAAREACRHPVAIDADLSAWTHRVRRADGGSAGV
jgi:MerR family copper efflux transcriptional regulator